MITLTLQLLKVGFNFETEELEQEFVTVREENRLEDFNYHINSRMIDIVTLTEDIAVIVDDEGLLVSDNPVFEFNIYGNTFQLAGTLLFASQDINSDNELELISLSNFDFQQLARKMEFNLIGITA